MLRLSNSTLSTLSNSIPRWLWPIAAEGVTYAGKSQWDLAITDLNKAIELDPQLAEAHNNRGWVYGSQGQWDLAIIDLNKAIELDPELAEAYFNRGSTYYYKGQEDLALADFNKVIELSSNPLIILEAEKYIAEISSD